MLAFKLGTTMECVEYGLILVQKKLILASSVVIYILQTAAACAL